VRLAGRDVRLRLDEEGGHRHLDLRIEARHAQQRLPLVDGRRVVAALEGELPARHQVEDEVLALGGRLEPDVLRRLDRHRQRQLVAEPARVRLRRPRG